MKLLPESPERELRELELAQSIVLPLGLTAGFSAPQTINAIDHAAVLVEKSGNLEQLFNLLYSQALAYSVGGNLQSAGALADRLLELALREGSPVRVGRAHLFQSYVRFFAGDLAGVEKHFAAGLKFFQNPDFIMESAGDTVTAFALGSWNAWILGRADTARNRDARMIVAENTTRFAQSWSAIHAAIFPTFLREYEQAEALAEQALELCEQHQLPWYAAINRGLLGAAQSHLGRVSEGIALMRRGIAEMLELGARLGMTNIIAELAAALGRDGGTVEALETVEQALRRGPMYLFTNLRICGYVANCC
jgi:tetratricopeptide (TPR) repeat protein